MAATFNELVSYINPGYILDTDHYFFRYDLPGTTTQNPDSEYRYNKEMTVDTSGNIYIGTGTWFSSPTYWGYVIKLNSLGVIQWRYKFSGNVKITNIVYSSAENAIYAAGFDGFNSNSFLAKLDTSGNLLWQRDVTYAGTSMRVSSLVVDSGGQPIVAGWWGSNSSYIYKFSANDTIQVQQVLTNPAISTLSIDSNDNLYASAMNRSTGTAVAIKMASNTSVTRAVEFSASYNLYINRVVGDASGNLYIAGMVSVFLGQTTGVFMKVEATTGLILWQKSYTSSLQTGNFKAAFWDLVVTGSNELYIVGVPNILKVNPDTGAVIWSNTGMSGFCLNVGTTDIISYCLGSGSQGTGAPTPFYIKVPKDGSLASPYISYQTPTPAGTIVYQPDSGMSVTDSSFTATTPTITNNSASMTITIPTYTLSTPTESSYKWNLFKVG